MKAGQIGIWLSVALVGFFAACRHSDPTPAVPKGYIELRAGTTIPIVNGINIVTDTAGVSYCPKNANCIIAGSAYASLRFINDQSSQRVRLFNVVGRTVYRPDELNRMDSTTVELAGQLYKVILRDQYIGEVDGESTGRPILMISRL